jgi:hypothetical protein
LSIKPIAALDVSSLTVSIRFNVPWPCIFACATFAALLIPWLAYKYISNLASLLKIRHEQYARPEAAYFKKLVHACRQNDSRETYPQLLQWLRHSKPEKTLDELLEQIGDTELTQQVTL